MDKTNCYNPLLALLDCPAFLVKDGTILQVNRAAEQMLFRPGSSVEPFLRTAAPVYHEFTDGCLYLSLYHLDTEYGAIVTVADGMHLFRLDQSDQAEQALALAAQHLRGPLSDLFIEADEEGVSRIPRVYRGLFQLHRIINNMADFPRYKDPIDLHMTAIDLNLFLSELMDKAATLAETAGMHLHYSALPQNVFLYGDHDMLERAIYNLISNAMKHSPPGGTIAAKFVQVGEMACISIHNQGMAITPDVLHNMFHSYLRSPGIDDGNRGLGLGLALVKIAALNHGGTVLIDCPEIGGTRVTMTLHLPTSDELMLCSTVCVPQHDYAGGQDHALLELSDVLPSKLYRRY